MVFRRTKWYFSVFGLLVLIAYIPNLCKYLQFTRFDRSSFFFEQFRPCHKHIPQSLFRTNILYALYRWKNSFVLIWQSYYYVELPQGLLHILCPKQFFFCSLSRNSPLKMCFHKSPFRWNQFYEWKSLLCRREVSRGTISASISIPLWSKRFFPSRIHKNVNP